MRQLRLPIFLLVPVLFCSSNLCAQQDSKAQTLPSPTVSPTPSPTPATTPTPKPEPMSSGTFAGMKFRSIGPAVTSGRVIAFAVNPNDRANFYVGAASGGVWKTDNAGTTWTPVFEKESSYSIGAVALDPNNPAVVWVGTGENNAQRSVGYGDGVYKSDDGGKSWKNMGLKTSEHIGKIVIDPRDSNTVFVAAQGPLWSAGGERGLYKTTDGGKTWKAVITVSENTGVTDVAFDPSNLDTMYAAAWQRRRHFYTLVDGGPESALYKSTDGGNTWTKLKSGLPPGDLGRIGIAVSPVDTNVVYATVEASGNLSGIFRSKDRGATWEKMSPNIAQAMYYGNIITDPKDVDRLYIPNVVFQVSDDGGKTQKPLGEKLKHVDNHAIWIDPKNTDYYLVGCDGGIYESFDRGENWNFKANLPVAQFYEVALDNNAPFYYVYGGTQDNNSLGGPSRTRHSAGIINADWFVTNGGDGFRSAVDQEDANTIYAESQNGGLVRFDKSTGENVDIPPIEGAGIESQRYNWDSPFIISPHSHTRLYFAGNKLFKSDNRGDDWTAISGDLTRHLDRNQLPVFGKIQSPDAIAKNQSTALYGNASTISESPKKAGLIYVGTDDGLIQVTENDGGSYRKIEKFPGIPDMSYVSRVLASQHDQNTVYALFNNHQNGDFKPYILKSTDLGKTWTSIAANLPERGSLYAIAEDYTDPNLLFVGTEFGLFFTVDGGQKWIQMKGNLPTIAVRDIAIQKQANDLVLATFGRGFYVLDDYSMMRQTNKQSLEQSSMLFPVKDALMYVRANTVFSGFQGSAFYTAPNPPYGAVLGYYLKDAPKTLKQIRQEAEREADKKKQPIRYPSIEELRTETEEDAPALLFTVSDEQGKVVRRLTAPATAGIQRVVWDMRYTPPAISAAPPRPSADPDLPEGFAGRGPQGPLVMPGKYSVAMAMRVRGVVTPMPGTQTFEVVVEGREKMTDAERAELVAFQRQLSDLQRAVGGANEVATVTKTRIGFLKRAAAEAPVANQQLINQAKQYDDEINDIINELRGGRENSDTPPPSITSRVSIVADTVRLSTIKPTQTQIAQYNLSAAEFKPVLARLRKLVEVDLPAFEKQLAAAGAPLTPGTLPQ